MHSCAQNLPKRRTVLTLRFQLIGVHVNIMRGQALCSESAGEVLGRGEAGSARGRAGSASCPCVIQSSNAEHEDPARSSHPREVDVQRKTPFCSFGLGRVRASMTRNPERLKKERHTCYGTKVVSRDTGWLRTRCSCLGEGCESSSCIARTRGMRLFAFKHRARSS